jgi:hypothetical protein
MVPNVLNGPEELERLDAIPGAAEPQPKESEYFAQSSQRPQRKSLFRPPLAKGERGGFAEWRRADAVQDMIGARNSFMSKAANALKFAQAAKILKHSVRSLTRRRNNPGLGKLLAKGFIVGSDEGRFWIVSIARKLDGKQGAFSQVTFHGYLAAVRFRNHLADNESETRSFVH